LGVGKPDVRDWRRVLNAFRSGGKPAFLKPGNCGNSLRCIPEGQSLYRKHDKTCTAITVKKIMVRYQKKPLSWIFVSRMMAIICFLIVVVLATIFMTVTTPDGIFQKAADGLLFSNFWLLLFIFVILFVADIFGTLEFPLNLPAPIIRAFGSAFCITYILIVFQWIDDNYGTAISQFSWLVPSFIVPLVFLVVLISGYYVIFRQLSEQPEKEGEDVSDTLMVQGEHYESAAQPTSDARSWEEIGEEFRGMIYDIFHRIREDIRIKK
jgi:hypothetical protein